jgi:hypothetical protein
MRFLPDMGLARSTAQHLRDCGYDALPLREQGLQRLPDAEIDVLPLRSSSPGGDQRGQPSQAEPPSLHFGRGHCKEFSAKGLSGKYKGAKRPSAATGCVPQLVSDSSNGQLCRRTISSIQIGANGEVQPLGTG